MDNQKFIQETVIALLGILIYCVLGFFLLIEIEDRLYGGEQPRYYRGFAASLLQTFWPVSLTIVVLVGLLMRRRKRHEPQRIRSVSS